MSVCLRRGLAVPQPGTHRGKFGQLVEELSLDELDRVGFVLKTALMLRVAFGG